MRISTSVIVIMFAFILPTMLLGNGSHCSCGAGRGAVRSGVAHTAYRVPASRMYRIPATMMHHSLPSYRFDPDSFIDQVMAGLGFSFIVGCLYNCWRAIRRWLKRLWSLKPCSHPWQTHEWSLSERLICIFLAAITTWLWMPSWISVVVCIGSMLIYFRTFHNDRSYRAVC